MAQKRIYTDFETGDMAIDWIERNYPGAIKFVATPAECSRIGEWVTPVTQESCFKIIGNYGLVTLLALLEWFKAAECYEECAAILAAVDKMAKDFKVDLPRSLHCKEGREMLRKSVKEIREDAKRK